MKSLGITQLAHSVPGHADTSPTLTESHVITLPIPAIFGNGANRVMVGDKVWRLLRVAGHVDEHKLMKKIRPLVQGEDFGLGLFLFRQLDRNVIVDLTHLDVIGQFIISFFI